MNHAPEGSKLGEVFYDRRCEGGRRRSDLPMKSLVIKHSVYPAGHRTSVSVEDDFWKALKEISRARQMTVSALIHKIDEQRHHANLSSAIRLFVLNFYRSQASAQVDREPRDRRSVPRQARNSV
jgi:predicted DNA-binding ribbon-helix-helix protein